MLRRLRTLLQPAHVRDFDPRTPQRDGEAWLALEPRILLDGALAETALVDPDASPVIDLNGPTEAGRNHGLIYPDREVATEIAAEDAFVADPQEDIAKIEIRVSGALVENKDAVRIGDRIINFSQDARFEDVAIGSALLHLDYDATTKIITMVDAEGAAIAASNVTQLVRTMSYGNLDLNPRQGTLNFEFRLTDAEGFSNEAASVDMVIESDGANPYALLDPDGSSSVDGLFRATFFEESGLGVAIADDDLVIVNRDNEPIRQVYITLSNPQEGDKLRIQVPSDIDGITANVRTLEDGSIRVTILTSSQAAGTNYEDLARVIGSVRFVNDSEDPSDITRLISVRLQEGSVFGTPTRLRLDVVPQNDAPTLDLDADEETEFGPDFGATWTEGGQSVPIILAGRSDIEDVDDEVLQSAVIWNATPEAGDRLYIESGLPVGINGEIAEDGQSIRLTGSASIAAYTRALETVRFAADPENPVEGERNVRVTLSDGRLSSNTATARITVEAVNDAPVVVPGPLDGLQEGEDAARLAPVSAADNFTDVDDDRLFYSFVGERPSWLSIDRETGEITGTPPRDASQQPGLETGREGRYAVTVRASDDDGAFAETQVVYQIANPVPVAADDENRANDGGPSVAGSVLTGSGADVDPDGDDLAVAYVEDSADNVGLPVPGSMGGTFVIAANGRYTFDPDEAFLSLKPGETATTSVTYRVSDAEGGFDTASLVVTVVGTNNAPVARDDVVDARADRPASGNLLIDNGAGPDRDPDGDRITVAQLNGEPLRAGERVSLPSGAVLVLREDGSYTYDPGRTFDALPLGATATDSFTYAVRDPFGLLSQATVSVTVEGANERPIPLDPSRPPIDPDGPEAPPTDPDDPRAPPFDPENYIPVQRHVDGQTMAPFALLPWFGDPDAGDRLRISVDQTTLPQGIAFDPATGALSGTFPADASQGGREGVYVVPVTATDLAGASFTTNLTISVSNPAPTAFDDRFEGSDREQTLGNVFRDNAAGADSDPDGDALFVASPVTPVRGSDGGVFTIGRNGSMTFDPRDDFADLKRGETRETATVYSISDGEGGRSSATVSVLVIGTNAPPRVSETAEARTGIDAVPVAAFDAARHFEDADGDTLTYALASGAPDWMTIDPVTGRVGGTPPNDASAGGENGTYRVAVLVSDGIAEATLPVTWTITNPAPNARDDSMRAPGDEVAELDLLRNDSDPDRDRFAIVAIEGEAIEEGAPIPLESGAVLVMEGPDDLHWRPTAAMAEMEQGQTLLETFTYTIEDAQGARSQAEARILVFGTRPVVEPPQPPEPPVVPPVLRPSPPTEPPAEPPEVPWSPWVPFDPFEPRVAMPSLPGGDPVGDPILTATIDAIDPLGSPVILDPNSPVPILTQALEGVERLGGDVSLFGSPSLREAIARIDAARNADERWQQLVGEAFEGGELTVGGLTLRSIVAGDVTYVDLGSFGGRAFERWTVKGDGGGRLFMLDRNIVQVERPADRNHVHLDVTGRDGSSRTWRLPLRVDTVHGELRAEGPFAPVDQTRRADIRETIRSAQAPKPLPVAGGETLLDLSKALGPQRCEVPTSARTGTGGATRG